MSKRLTDKEKAEVVADFIAGMSKSDIAKKFQVTHTAISKILDKQESFKTDEKVSKSCKELRKEIIEKATNALYIKNFNELSPDVLLRVIERLSVLEPSNNEENNEIKFTLEITDVSGGNND